jgi:hypothetical protein
MIKTETLKQFVSQDDMRPAICSPFVRDGHTFFTDGRILIRIPRVVEEYVIAHKEAPSGAKMRELFDSWPADLKFVPPPLATIVDCIHCDKTGRTDTVTCDCCGGGVVLDCEIPCQECDGTGQALDYKIKEVKFENTSLNPYYVRKLHLLPGAMIAPNAEPEKSIYIKFDGGDGRLMPL